MLIRVRISTEFAFLLSGVFIMAVAWALNLLGVLSGQAGSDHGGSDVILWAFLMFQGLAFSTVGVIYGNYRELLTNPIVAKRYLAGFLFIADGGLHLLAFNQHLTVPFAAAFFAVVSPIQFAVGIAFPRAHRRFDPLWLLFTAFLITAFVATRTVAIWPFGGVEDVNPLGVISKVVEVTTLGVLISLLVGENRRRRESPSLPTTNGP